ncbi:MAG: hypothetical protein KIT63_06600 [Rhodoferax sp.]|nr:hypothetical protein [Rhodoferax sp.]
MNRRVVFVVLTASGLMMVGGSNAQVCVHSYRDVHDRYQLAGLKLGDDAARLFDLQSRASNCVRAKMRDEEYGCSYTSSDGTQFQAYGGRIVQAVVPAAALRGGRVLADIHTHDELRTVIRKLELHRPERFPAWRVFFDPDTQGVVLSTFQCLVSDNGEHWELSLQFDTTGPIKAVAAYVPYP